MIEFYEFLLVWQEQKTRYPKKNAILKDSQLIDFCRLIGRNVFGFRHRENVEFVEMLWGAIGISDDIPNAR